MYSELNTRPLSYMYTFDGSHLLRNNLTYILVRKNSYTFAVWFALLLANQRAVMKSKRLSQSLYNLQTRTHDRLWRRHDLQPRQASRAEPYNATP
jgi:hypothetical protein